MEEKIEQEAKKEIKKSSEVKMKPSEFAIQEKLDPHLFLYWDNKLVTKKEYEKIRDSVYNTKKYKL